MFDSERNKQQQRVLCNEIRRLPNETIKQIAVRIETLVRKAYSLNTHDYKNTKMTEILMMTLTPQLRKIAIKKRASHPSSIREPDLDFRKLVDKLEQAEITMKLEETENLKLQYVTKLKRLPLILIIYKNQKQISLKKSLKYSIFTKRTRTLKANHLSRNGVIIADDTDIVFPNVDKNSKIVKINLKNTKNQINHFINT